MAKTALEKMTPERQSGCADEVSRAPKPSKVGAEKLTPDAPALSQLDKFNEAARELGTDDDPERFKEMVRKIGSAKPAPGPSKAKASKGG